MLSIWFALVSLGFAGLGAYGIQAGETGRVPQTWPVDLAREPGATALCFVHPKCPCSRATLAELRRLKSSLSDSASLEFVIFQPQDSQTFWGDEPWKGIYAASLLEDSDGNRVRLDPGGELALKFGALTSGMVLAYGAGGELCFQGGITATRGHEGPSPAQAWLASALAPGSVPSLQAAPVFGCPIRALDDRATEGCCDPQQSKKR